MELSVIRARRALDLVQYLGTVNLVSKKYCRSFGIMCIVFLKLNVSNIQISVRKTIQPLLSGIDFVEKSVLSGSGREKNTKIRWVWKDCQDG